MPPEFKFSIDECDVPNKSGLSLYRAARTKWLTWLEHDEHHALWKQITAMLWNDAVFRMVNEARRFSEVDSRTAASNGMLAGLIDVGYVASQVLAIWKLMDSRRDVISLRRLFDNIVANRHLLTREHFVAYDGVPYDYEAAMKEYYAGWTLEAMGQFHGLPIDGPHAFGTSEIMHQAFDRLCGTTPEMRSRQDVISDRAIETIEGWFNDPILKKLSEIRHKFIAHAADENSRAAIGLDHIGVTLGEVEQAHQLIVRICEVITAQLLYDAHHGQVVPIPQFNQFAALDTHFVPKNAINELSRWWHQHMESRAKWTKGPIKLIPDPTPADA